MSSLLEIDSVVKSFDDRQLLTDIYLKCGTGDVIGIMGRNGTGKSTLLKILFGIEPADHKFIRIDGKVYNSPYKTKGELCYLPQHEFLPKHLSVKKVVSLYLDGDTAESFFDDALLAKLSENRITELSSGELRYLEIKLLLHTDSKFILLDEPFNGVSPVLIETMKPMILKASENKGIILTDHDYRNVLDIANRYCLIYDGGIKEIRDKYDLVRWGYVTEAMI